MALVGYMHRDLVERRGWISGIVAKRKADPYAVGVTWIKIKNRAYSQMEWRGELFHPPRGALSDRAEERHVEPRHRG